MSKKRKKMPKKRKNKPTRHNDIVSGGPNDFIEVMVIDADGTETKKLMTHDELASARRVRKMHHSELSHTQSALARFSYKHAGRIIVANYEEWELGFLTEPDPDTEIGFWFQVSLFLIHIKPKNDTVSQAIIRDWCSGNLSPSLKKKIEAFSVSDEKERLLEIAIQEIKPED